MQHSENLHELGAALVNAQQEMEPAKKGAQNPHLGNKYADLGSVWEAVHQALHKHGLSVLQGVSGNSGQVTVSTMLLHTSGQWIRDALTLPYVANRGINEAQAAGSAISYARRYGLSALLSVPTEDDDGQSATDRAVANPAKGKPQGKPQTSKDGASASQPTAAVKSVLAAAAKADVSREQVEQWLGKRLEDTPVDDLRVCRERIKSGDLTRDLSLPPSGLPEDVQ